MQSTYPKQPVEFSFAGFEWPRNVQSLAMSHAARKRRYKPYRVCGPYIVLPSVIQERDREIFFYLESDFSLGLRWGWVDALDSDWGYSPRILHTGWHVGEDCFDKIRGVVFKLPNRRGFLAGWSMGEGMASGLSTHIWDEDDLVGAAYAADRMAENTAELNRQLDEDQLAAA